MGRISHTPNLVGKARKNHEKCSKLSAGIGDTEEIGLLGDTLPGRTIGNPTRIRDSFVNSFLCFANFLLGESWCLRVSSFWCVMCTLPGNLEIPIWLVFDRKYIFNSGSLTNGNHFSNIWQSLVSYLTFMGVTKKVLFEIQVYESSQVDISTLVDDSSPSFGWKLGVNIAPVWGIIVKQLTLIFWRIPVGFKNIIMKITLPETNIALENRPLEKEIRIGNHHF